MSTIKDTEVPTFTTFLNEGGKSGGARYNTELASLLVFTGGSLKDLDPKSPDFDPSKHWKKSKLKNADKVYDQIKTFLPKNYKKELFNSFYALSVKDKPKIEKSVGKVPKLGWVGGENLSGSDSNPADVDFINHDAFGISIKDSGGITLSNLSPKTLGLAQPFGVGVLNFYSSITSENTGKTVNLYRLFKKNVFLKTVFAVDKLKVGTPLIPNSKSPHYSIKKLIDGYYEIGFKRSGKKLVVVKSKQEILDPKNFEKNLIWHRVFGDYLVHNANVFQKYTSQYYEQIGLNIIDIIKQALSNEKTLIRLLNMGKKPYIYQSPKALYRVPAISEIKDKELLLKKLTYKEKKGGGGLQFLMHVGSPDSKESAIIDLHIRYANGAFTTNPTVRIQSMKNAESIFWEAL